LLPCRRALAFAASVELLRLTVDMVESAFDEFAGFRIHHRNLLEARMKIYRGINIAQSSSRFAVIRKNGLVDLLHVEDALSVDRSLIG